MAVTTDSLLIDIKVNTGKSAQAVEGLTKDLGGLKKELGDVSKSTKKTSDAFGSITGSYTNLASAISIASAAYGKLKGAIDSVIGEFTNQDTQNRKLANTLKLVGDFTQETYLSFREFASTMQDTINVGDDVVLSMLSLAKATGLTNEQSKQLIKTSADVAAVTGKDIKSSLEELLGQYSGVQGRLAKLVPELKNLTEEELKSGKGIDIVSAKFDGFAKAGMNTLSGSMIALKNNFGDFLETIGQVFIETTNMNKSTASMSQMFKDLGSYVMENRDTFVSWGKTILSIADDVGNIFAGAISLVSGMFITLASRATTATRVIAQGLSYIGVVSKDTVNSLSEVEASLYDTGQTAYSISSSYFKAIGDTSDSVFEQVTGDINQVDDSLQNAKKTLESLPINFKELQKAGEQALDALNKKISALAQENAKIGASESQVMAQKYEANIKEIQQYEQKLTAAKMLTQANKDLIKQARELAEVGYKSELATIQKKNLDDILQKNKEMTAVLLDADGRHLEAINLKYQKELDALELKRESLALDEKGIAALDEQKKLLESAREKETKNAPGVQFEGLAQTGKEIGDNLSNVFKNGAAELVGGFASMLSGIMAAIDAAIGIINTILDFIPKILNAVADIFNKITDLPNVILEAVKNLGDSVVRFVGEFIPNLLKAIPQIVMSLIKALLVELPKAFIEMLKLLPTLIIQMIDALVDSVDDFIAGIVAAMPRMAIALVVGIVQNAPRIAFAIAKALAVDVPKMIIKGIVEGFRAIWDSIKGIFGGKGLKVPLDVKSLTNGVKELGRTLSGEASKLFAVLDLQQAAKASEKAQDLANQIEEGMRKASNWLRETWDKIFGALKDAWMWVYDNVVKPIIDGLTALWRWVWDNVLQPVIKGLNDIWTWVNDKVVQPLITGLSAVFKWIIDKVVQPLIGVGTKIWEGLKAGLAGAGDLLTGLGTKIWEGLKKGLSTLGKFFTDMFDKINPANLFEKIFKVDYKGKGTVEKALGVDIPFLNFATGGMVPGNASISGDSLLNDRILAMLSPGEAIVPRSIMSDPILGAVIKAIIDGTLKVPQYGFGDVISSGVSSVGSAVGSVVSTAKDVGGQVSGAAKEAGGKIAESGKEVLSNLDPKQMWEKVKELVFGDMFWKMFENNKFHSGGLVPSFAFGGEVPALLQPGEFVMKRTAVNSIGTGALNAMNNGQSTVQNATFNINLNIETTQQIDDTFIRQKLMPKIKDSFRRASLDGDFIISKSGVR